MRTASIEQLLAMKLAAWRDAIDRADARLLLEQLTGSMDEVWAAVNPPGSPDQAGQGLVRISRSLGARPWNFVTSFAQFFLETSWPRVNGSPTPNERD
ncbi:MAG: hypothetical protein ACOY0T_10480 [Myxococcota bacterium]